MLESGCACEIGLSSAALSPLSLISSLLGQEWSEPSWRLVGWTPGPRPEGTAEAQLAGADRWVPGSEAWGGRPPRGLHRRDPGAGWGGGEVCSAARVGAGEFDRSQGKRTKNKHKTHRFPHVSLQKNRGWSRKRGRLSRIPRGHLRRPPSAWRSEERSPGPRPAPLWAPRGGRGEARDSFHSSFPSTRLCSSVVNKVSPPPPRWFAS